VIAVAAAARTSMVVRLTASTVGKRASVVGGTAGGRHRRPEPIGQS